MYNSRMVNHSGNIPLVEGAFVQGTSSMTSNCRPKNVFVSQDRKGQEHSMRTHQWMMMNVIFGR